MFEIKYQASHVIHFSEANNGDHPDVLYYVIMLRNPKKNRRDKRTGFICLNV